MEKVVFNEVAIANRIALIRQAYEDLIPVKDRLKDIENIARAQPDYFTAIPSCMAFTAQYTKTTGSVIALFQDAQDSLDAVLDVYRETVATMYAANEAIAADFAAITNLQLNMVQPAAPVAQLSFRDLMSNSPSGGSADRALGPTPTIPGG